MKNMKGEIEKMKATGITRPIDKLGRVVIPMELRRTFNLNVDDRMKFFTEGNKIIIEKDEEGCTFCNSRHNLTEFGGQKVCGYCREDLRKGLR
jgi:transcriptional pleiotropic regulator of transition state genes